LVPAALLTFLLVVFSSLIIVRIGTVALKMTGLSKEVAAFQAQSAFSGVGFTTSESEMVVSHPVRRKIIRMLMLLGSAGITSAIASLLLTFIGTTQLEAVTNLLLLAAGILLIYLFSRSRLIDRAMSRFIEWALNRWTSIRVMDYEHILGLSKGYSVSILKVKPGGWLEGKTLEELKLNEEGVLVLGIYRKHGDKEIYIGAPRGPFELKAGDKIVCYGPEETLSTLPDRLKGPIGDAEHEIAVTAQIARELSEKEELSKTEAS
jgi:hypothetical protein